MRAIISGKVMEIKAEFDDKKNRLATVTAMIFQRGEKDLVAVKKVPAELVSEEKEIKGLPIRASIYNFQGHFGLSTVYDSETVYGKAQ